MYELNIYLVNEVKSEEEAFAKVQHELGVMFHEYSPWDSWELLKDSKAFEDLNMEPIYSVNSEEGKAVLEEHWAVFEKLDKNRPDMLNQAFSVFYQANAVLGRSMLDFILETSEELYIVPVVFKA